MRPLLPQQEPWETDGVSSALGIVIINKGSVQQIILWMTQTTTFLGLQSLYWSHRYLCWAILNCPTEDAQNAMVLALLSSASFQNKLNNTAVNATFGVGAVFANSWTQQTWLEKESWWPRKHHFCTVPLVVTTGFPGIVTNMGSVCGCFPGATGNMAAWQALERSVQRMQRPAHSSPLLPGLTLDINTDHSLSLTFWPVLSLWRVVP